jgi:hypothetical protein
MLAGTGESSWPLKYLAVKYYIYFNLSKFVDHISSQPLWSDPTGEIL